MTIAQFNTWNTRLGWLTFLIALITYVLTVEPAVSFWDAGEYILTASKLQVGHPPGAPFFQMLGAFFSIFAFKVEHIGLMLNMMSAVASAFTILFMYWSISLLLKGLVAKKDEITKDKGHAILGSALVGSLAFAFTDSFWFNAVETEVYAMATLIMAVMFYLGLRWEQDMYKPRANKWLILIAFIIGLSFGVHFMGLLTIPAIGLIYYFKNYKTITLKNFITANLAVIAILLFIFKLLLPNALRFFSASELFFVNQIGLPFNSGSIIAALIIIAVFYFGIKYTIKKQYKNANTLLLCILFIFIGFSSWLMLPIRANANVIINENNPSSARELLAYYNLEQYPKTHLFYGPLFTDYYAGLNESNPYVDAKPKYEKDKTQGKYVVVNDYKDAEYNYNDEHASILPRMWSPENSKNYMLYSGYLDFDLKAEYFMDEELREFISNFKGQVAQGLIDYEGYDQFLKDYGQALNIKKPSLWENIVYLWEYQLGYMYWRYFMWNFAGRQDDIQGKYDLHGDWISGIKFIDQWHLGISQDNLPQDVINNKARNTYYFLPLILGLIGLFFLFNKDKKWFWTMLVFFLFTGLAIQFYTNVRPFEPRERDYSVVGSFYVFAIWIGFGVYALYEMLSASLKSQFLVAGITVMCLIAVPGILAANNWDDHDRSGRKTAKAMAQKYLESCAPNAILFTIGDNDTFPLWYLQEIEGVRTDVRVINTSLFQTDWYIDQMKRKAYESDPIPSQLTHDQYKWGSRDMIQKRITTRDTIDIKQVLNFITNEDPRTKMKYVLEQDDEIDINRIRRQDLNANYLPTEFIRIPVDKETVLKQGIVKEKDADSIVPYIDIRITSSGITKNRLLMLDIVANNNWERPIYFSGGSFGDDDYIWMKDYLQLDGLCYKLVPIKTAVDTANPFDMGRIDSDLMYTMVKSWDWGNSGKDMYHDVETRKNGITYRGNLARLVETLINEEKFEKAEEIADLAMEKLPVDVFEYYSLLEPYIGAYYELNSNEKARQLYFDVSKKYQDELNYYSHLSEKNQITYIEEVYSNIQYYRGLIDVIVRYEDEGFAEEEMKKFNNYIKLFTDDTYDEDDMLNTINDDLIPSDSISLDAIENK